MRAMIWNLFLLLRLALPGALPAQSDSTNVVHGAVRDSAGKAMVGVDVFLLSTLEGGATDSLGRFTFRTAARGPVTLMARKIGLLPARLSVKPALLEKRSITYGPVLAPTWRGRLIRFYQIFS